MITSTLKNRILPFTLLLVYTLWLLNACNNKPQTTVNPPAPDTTATTQPTDTVSNGSLLTPQQAKAIIEQRANSALKAIAGNDMQQLATLVHPVKGVRFSPYAFINTDTDMVFQPQQVAKLATEVQKHTWGMYDGSGEPITLTYNEYRRKFVTDKDYLNKADSVGYNQIIGQGNSINNREKVYTTAIITEYYQSGKNPDFGGMDWSSLALAFEKYNTQWYLTGIMHNGWTI